MHILLADDDIDDCLLFEEAMRKISSSAVLSVVHDGEELILYLQNTSRPLPYVIFLDLNMPRKDGYRSLVEIKNTPRLKDITVIIISTSSDQKIIDQVKAQGALYYFRKPPDFVTLRNMLRVALVNLEECRLSKRVEGDFVIAQEKKVQD